MQKVWKRSLANIFSYLLSAASCHCQGHELQDGFDCRTLCLGTLGPNRSSLLRLPIYNQKGTLDQPVERQSGYLLIYR